MVEMKIRDQLISRRVIDVFGLDWLQSSPVHLEATNFVQKCNLWLNNQLDGAIFLFKSYETINATDRLAKIYEDPRFSLLNHTSCLFGWSADSEIIMATILPQMKENIDYEKDGIGDIEFKVDMSNLIRFETEICTQGLLIVPNMVVNMHCP